MRRAAEPLRVVRQRLDLLGQFLGIEAFLADHARAAGFRQFAGVGGLVIIGRDRQRNEDRRPPDGSKFGDGRCPGAADEQMRIGQPRRHVLEIGRQFGGYGMVAIPLAHSVEIFGPALLGDLQPLAQRGGKHRQPVGHHFGQDAGALAAAGHQHPQQAFLAQWREGFVAQRQYARAYRIADQMHFPEMFGIEPFDFGIGSGDRIDVPREQPVHPAQHRVLFMHHGGHARALRRQHGR